MSRYSVEDFAADTGGTNLSSASGKLSVSAFVDWCHNCIFSFLRVGVVVLASMKKMKNEATKVTEPSSILL